MTEPRSPIVFTLPFALMSANVRQRTHWRELTAYRKQLVYEVMAAIGGPRHYPRPPFDRARVTICRCSAGTLDTDNLVAACKPLIDVLCAASLRHPDSLGIIEDDNPRQLELIATQAAVGQGNGVTVVRVEHVPGGPLSAAPKAKRRRNTLASAVTNIAS